MEIRQNIVFFHLFAKNESWVSLKKQLMALTLWKWWI